MNRFLNIFRFLFSFLRDALQGVVGAHSESSPSPSRAGGLFPTNNENSKQATNKFPLLRGGLGRGLFLLLFAFYSILANAQNFPVQVIPQAVPPAPIYISNYADASTVSSPLRVQIILNDFDIANREIRLKTYFTGSGLSFQSNDLVVGASPLFLEGGVPLILTNVELAPYFEFNNITGINANQYGNAIPEGAYQFCVEVYDVLTGSRLSNRSCAVSVVFQNEPPFLVLPRNKTNVEEVNPQYIVFQWTPRSINVSNVQYELSLVEIWDNQVDPQQAFLSSPPVFQTTTTATTYVYGPTDPLLLSGKNYAWRVQAKAQQGTEEIGLFKNEGYSEIFSFSYAEACELPIGINHEVKGSTNANIFWDDFSTEIPEYTVRYRQKNSSSSDNEWFFSKTNSNNITIWDLRAGGTYEYQLQNTCTVAESQWSIVKEFTTFIADDEDSVYDCNISPDFNITNREPLPNMGVGDKFTAGDFPITVQEVNGSNGRFNGKGYVTIPYLSSIKVGVQFTNIEVNTENQLIEGEVVTMYDPTLSNILDVDDAIDTVNDVVDSVGEFFEGDNDLDEIQVDWTIGSKDDITIEDGMVVITNPYNGVTTKEPLGDDMVITDQEGNTYYVSPEGEITEGGQITPGGEVNPGNVTGVSNNGDLQSLTAENIIVKFNTKGTYGFDKMPAAANNDLKKEYQIIKDFDGNDYVLSHHAVKNGGTTQLQATIEIQNNAYTPDQVVFKNKQGKIFTPTINGNTATITLDGVYTFENETIYALVPSKEDADKQLTAGAFTLWHLAEKTIDVAIVSVGASVGDIATTVNNIFGNGVAQINFKNTISVDVSAAQAALGTNGMDVGESPLTAAYNDEQRALRALAKSAGANDSDTYYVIVLGSQFDNTKGIAGFMPLQRQFGFVFQKYAGSGEEAKGNIAKTVAHEIGHGIFALQHPFAQYGMPESSTNWLMDYSNGTNLPHTHWSQMHDPAIRFYVFQDGEDGELGGEIWFTPDWRPVAINGTSTISYTSNSVKVKGTLPGFNINGKRYIALFSPSGEFVDYYEDGKSDGAIYNILPINESNLRSKNVFLFVLGNECNYAYSASYEYVIQNRSTISFEDSNNNLTKSDRIKCWNCEKGQEFISQYENITNQEIQDKIQEIADLLCANSAYEHFIDALTQEGIDNLFAWQQVDYFEGFGDQSLEAFQEFKEVLIDYMKFYEAAKGIIETSNDRNTLLKLAYNLSTVQMRALPIADKLKMLQIIASGHLSGYWTSSNYNSEAIALKVINSIEDDEASDFINGISSDNYAIDDTMLYQVLYDKIDDFFGSSNFTTIAHKFNDFALKAKGLDYDSLTNEQIEQTAGDNRFIWDVENADYWLVKFVNDKNPIVTLKTGNTFTLKQNCIDYLESNYDPYGSSPPTVCLEYDKDISGLGPFDLVSINIIEDINITQSSVYPFDYAISGKTTLVPVSFIQYLQTKKSNQQLTNFAFNTLTVASIYFSSATIVAARGVSTVAARLALADLIITFSDPYFSNPLYFKTHATQILTETYNLTPEQADDLTDILVAGWTIAATGATISTGRDLSDPNEHFKALATYKALVNKVGGNKAKELISKDVVKRNKIVENFEAFEEDLISNPSVKSKLDDKVAEIENFDEFKLLDELSLNKYLNNDVLTLTSGWDDDALDLLFNDLLDDAQGGGDLISALNQKPELVNAWDIIKNSQHRIKTGALELFSDPVVLASRQKILDEGIDVIFPNISLEELTAIRHYTTNAYTELNSALRSGSPNDYFKSFDEILNDGLNNLPDYTGSSVYRGVQGAEANIAKTWNVGDDINFKDFKSTSTSSNVANDFAGNVVYEIANPKGKAICQISCLPGESEVLFKSGSNFKVDNIQENFVIYDNDANPFTVTKIFLKYLD